LRWFFIVVVLDVWRWSFILDILLGVGVILEEFNNWGFVVLVPVWGHWLVDSVGLSWFTPEVVGESWGWFRFNFIVILLRVVGVEINVGFFIVVSPCNGNWFVLNEGGGLLLIVRAIDSGGCYEVINIG
jgi:hypothetical protein